MAGAIAISVVIVNWNARDALEECLVSLEAQTDADFETIVVDNGSHDGSIERVRERFPRVKLIDTGANLGFAEGCNVGIAAASGSWIATLNNDTVVDARWIAELHEAARGAGPGVGMLQSRIVFRRAPARTNSTGVLLFRNGSARDRDFDVPVRDDDALEEIFCPTAGAALYRRSMLERTRLPTGFFDRTFFMYFEDVDLGWRCRLAGYTALYVPGARVEHEFQMSSKKRPGRFIGMHLKRNRMRMLLKNGSLSFIARTLPKTLFDAFEAVLWEGPGALPGLVRAALDGARQRPAVERFRRAGRDDVERRWLSPSPPEDAIPRVILDALASLVGK